MNLVVAQTSIMPIVVKSISIVNQRTHFSWLRIIPNCESLGLVYGLYRKYKNYNLNNQNIEHISQIFN